MDTLSEPAAKAARHLRHLVEQLKKLADRLLGGRRQILAALLGPGTPFLDIGPLLAYDQYEGEAPGLGSVSPRSTTGTQWSKTITEKEHKRVWLEFSLC